MLSRGESEDYVIDYNAGEVKFNTTYPITANMRIRVEYQYTDRNYTRFIGFGGGNYTSEKLDIGAYVYSESDAKNQPLQQDFDLNDRITLQSIGDNIELAVGSGIDSIGFNENFNMYSKIDSLGYEVYRYSTNQEEAIYQLIFSNVGNGNGDYVLADNNALGKVFKWVEPDTIPSIGLVKNGNYSPVKKLVTPKKRQILTVGGNRKWLSSNLKYEISSSNMDLNTFSKVGNNDNFGFAGRFIFEYQKKINQKWRINQELGIESISKNYERIERFREVEFERNWNIQQLIKKQDQILSSAKIDLTHLENGFLKYGINSFWIREDFNGFKNEIKINWNKDVFLDFDAS